MSSRTVIWIVVVVQSLCALVFVAEIAAPLLGIRYAPLDWRLREVFELAAALGLLLGILLGAILLGRSRRRTEEAEAALRIASETFMDLLEERFVEWRLTPAERDVALFALKGLSIAEIARMRQTSEGTVKAQTNAIYRKAGVSSRSQLLSLFIDDLMGEDVFGPRSSAAAR